jgi:uroporphyrinogen-III synthase
MPCCPRALAPFSKKSMVASKRLNVLVTRPAGPAADDLSAKLEALGYQVYRQPMLVLEGLNTLPDEQQCLLRELDQFQHIIFISTNAVRFGLEAIENQWPQLPAEVHWYAIGDATARQLSEHAINAQTPAEYMTSEGLLNLPELQSVRGDRVLIVKGEGGRDTLGVELKARGARVEELACYRRLSPSLQPGHLGAQIKQWDMDVILFSSGEGLANFRQLLRPEETTNLSSLSLVVPSERVARMAREMGFDRIAVADNASDVGMLRALESCLPLPEGEK